MTCREVENSLSEQFEGILIPRPPNLAARVNSAHSKSFGGGLAGMRSNLRASSTA